MNETRQCEREPVKPVVDSEMRDFMLVTRRALLLICNYIEKRYIVK